MAVMVGMFHLTGEVGNLTIEFKGMKYMRVHSFLLYTSFFFIRIYFIRILRLKMAQKLIRQLSLDSNCLDLIN